MIWVGTPGNLREYVESYEGGAKGGVLDRELADRFTEAMACAPSPDSRRIDGPGAWLDVGG